MIKPIKARPQTIAFQYPCYICREVFFTEINVNSHVICHHGFMLNERPNGINKRPYEANYEYQEFPLPKESIDAVIHSACPSCWYHCPIEDFTEFEEHIQNVHEPQHYLVANYQFSEASDNNGESSGKAHEENKREYADQQPKEPHEPSLDNVFHKLVELEEMINKYFTREEFEEMAQEPSIKEEKNQ
jgi:hypothetical protein